MNYFLRTIIGLSLILLAMSVTALSCNKVGDDNKNNANNANNSGGGGTGGGGGGGNNPPPAGTIVFENFDTSIAEMVGNTIQLKASGFNSDFSAWTANMNDFSGPGGIRTTLKKAFDITISSEGAKAKEGLIMVGHGNLANINAFSLDPLNKAIGSYSAAELKDGIVTRVNATGNNGPFYRAGWNILGGFMNSIAPTSADEAKASNAPFAFTPTTGAIGVQPFLYCIATVGSITSAAAAQDTTALTGGQTATCYAGVLGAAFTAKTADDWLKKKENNDPNFKGKFNIAVGGLKTDGKTIAQIGLTGNAAALRDGITTAEMAQITAVTSSGYTNVAVEVVRDAGFTYKAPDPLVIKIENLATDVSTNTTGDAIQIKASVFPATATSATITDGIGSLATAAANSLKPVFDITITGGDADTNNRITPTGGLVMVGPGNFTKVDDFSDTTGAKASLDPALKEGYGSGARGNNTIGVYQQPGLNFYGFFMEDTAPTVAGADTSPFAFTASGGSHPFLFCRTTLPDFRDGYNSTDTFTGGKTASCYIGSKGTAFSGQSATWLATAASATFKKTFNIAIGAIRTDGDTLFTLIPGSSEPEKIGNFDDGLDSTEIANIAARYPDAFKKFSVTIVP